MIYVDADRCTSCGACAVACPQAAIEIRNAKPMIDSTHCDGCERCLDACPERALYSLTTAPAERVALLPKMMEGERRVSVLPTPAFVLRRLAEGLAPIALDTVVSLLDQWLSNRAVSSQAGSKTACRRTDAPRGRRRWRRGWR